MIPTRKISRHWTEEELLKLESGWGLHTIQQISESVSRTPMAVLRKASDLGFGGLMKGKKSLKKLTEETGYQYSTLKIVMHNLGIKLKKVSRGDRSYTKKSCRHYSVSEEQEQAIIRYLKENRHRPKHLLNTSKKSHRDLWGTGTKPPACLGCSQTKSKHYARGLCKSCYNRATRKRSTTQRSYVRNAVGMFASNPQ